MLVLKEKTKIPEKILKNFNKDVSVIGKGGYGLVLKVVDSKTGNSYAAKIIQIEVEEDKKIIESELLLLKNGLSHKNIVQTLRWENHEDWYLFVMELGLCNLLQELEEFNLKKKTKSKTETVNLKLKKKRSEAEKNKLELEEAKSGTTKVEWKKKKNESVEGFPFLKCLRILNDVLDALIYASNQKINYRDVKPSNVIKFQDCYKLADWGTAYKKKESDSNTMRTAKIDGAGTYLYMAPELIEELDFRIKEKKNLKINFEKCDVFALGVLILQIYFGFSKESLKDFKVSIINDNKSMEKYLLSFKRDSPDDFCSLVSKMLYLDYSRRPTFIDIKEKLKSYEFGFDNSYSPKNICDIIKEDEDSHITHSSEENLKEGDCNFFQYFI